MTIDFASSQVDRRSLRLKSYDYSRDGLYFVTLCVENMAFLLGEIRNAKVFLNATGLMVDSVWNELPKRFPFVRLDAYVVMPNHFHGILALTGNSGDRASRDRSPGTIPNSLGRVLQAFKSITSREYIKTLELQRRPFSKLWHRNYFEKVIKHHVSLANIRKYIKENPLKWESDENHPQNIHRPPGELKVRPYNY